MAEMNPIPDSFEALVRRRRSTVRSSLLPDPADRKALRVRAGISQAEMAKALGVHPETFGRWERGDGRPGRNSLDDYAQALLVLRECTS
jgi:DNA-binding XRE family transcriptional regulator